MPGEKDVIAAYDATWKAAIESMLKFIGEVLVPCAFGIALIICSIVGFWHYRHGGQYAMDHTETAHTSGTLALVVLFFAMGICSVVKSFF